jgi:DNA-binding FadR family transcriptional regulator
MSDRNALVGRLVPFLLLRRYEPGERVPSERELAGRFHVSRGQIREALSYLEALRVIERRAKSGIYMAGHDTTADALTPLAQTIPLTAADVRQSVELRRIHELAAVALACERRTEDNLARLNDILAAEAAHVAAGASMAEDDRLFHAEIARATQNAVFSRIVGIFHLMTAAQRSLYFRDTARGRQSHGEHLSLFAAIDRRDTDAATTLMAAHLHGVDRNWQHLIEHDEVRVVAEAS